LNQKNYFLNFKQKNNEPKIKKEPENYSRKFCDVTTKLNNDKNGEECNAKTKFEERHSEANP
jgi:hypothetical protein